jgi:hypothetical protein
VILVAVFVPLEKLFALRLSKIWRTQAGVDLSWYFINSLLPGHHQLAHCHSGVDAARR